MLFVFSKKALLVYFCALCFLLILLCILVVRILSKGYINIKNESGTKKFRALSEIDRKKDIKIIADDISFYDLFLSFKSFLVNEMNLYYEDRVIKGFLASVFTLNFILIQGVSGTGKTTLGYAFSKYLENEATIVSIEPVWKDKTDLIGYYNEFTKTYNETILLKTLYKSLKSNELFIVILDELNISKVEYYFADFLSALELPIDQRYINLTSKVDKNDPKLIKDGSIMLSPNVIFVGTANNDDTTFHISNKVYDRASVLTFNKRNEKYDFKKIKKYKISYDLIKKLREEALEKYRIDKEVLDKIYDLDDYLYNHFEFGFGNRLIKKLSNYYSVYQALNGDKYEAIDNILSENLLIKLQDVKLSKLNKEKEELIKKVKSLFDDNLKETLRIIERV